MRHDHDHEFDFAGGLALGLLFSGLAWGVMVVALSRMF
jgi:hypothetical protein